jgi:hypothetical protein
MVEGEVLIEEVAQDAAEEIVAERADPVGAAEDVVEHEHDGRAEERVDNAHDEERQELTT